MIFWDKEINEIFPDCRLVLKDYDEYLAKREQDVRLVEEVKFSYRFLGFMIEKYFSKVSRDMLISERILNQDVDIRVKTTFESFPEKPFQCLKTHVKIENLMKDKDNEEVIVNLIHLILRLLLLYFVNYIVAVLVEYKNVKSEDYHIPLVLESII